MTNWETSYFEHFAKIPECSWMEIFSGPEFYSRTRCLQLFHEVVGRSPATEPMDKIMHWDLQTYLTGLFHQDDRMSMAASLESRVPFADPRLVRFAFKVNPDLRFRGGASKWILRKAVSTMLPPLVLSRRKVGFDTPAEAWIHQHEDFVRDTLLSTRSLERGFWSRSGLESLLASKQFDILWKVLSIELWASIFLDGTNARPSTTPGVSERSIEITPQTKLPLHLKVRYLAREAVELGVKGTLARSAWEIKTRSGFARLAVPETSSEVQATAFLNSGGRKLPFADPKDAADAIRSLISPRDAERIAWLASEATRGRILCFGRWMADFGNPIDWHRDPTNEHRWPADAHWTKAIQGGHGRTEIKFVWEAARFPQAYFLARAAALDPSAAPDLAAAFSSQVLGFIDRNPPGRGVHWFSGQEIALRHIAWLFGIRVFSAFGLVADSLRTAVGRSLAASAAHIARHIEYARDSVYNNHLLSEALGLYVAGSLLPGADAERWRKEGFELLSEAAGRMVYRDGGYLQDSHNYHRVAMQIYLCAAAFMRANGEQPPRAWIAAMERSLDFLLAHQNPADGRLPNYGANDGSNPLLLTTADFSDFRPVLQALSVVTRGERIYAPGPWDETAVWLSGPEVLALPARIPRKTSVSFTPSGYQVLRGTEANSFCAFRCGSILDRFAQIDMLHLDVWWRGENVLADAGTYLYNGPARWHRHFLRTESHSTVQIDGRDQMPHVRQFKTLYKTQARILRFEDTPEWAISEGEHYGYRRDGKCIHRRAALFLKGADLWVIVDTISGEGSHWARLHWLAGDYPHDFDRNGARLGLETPQGRFTVTILDRTGAPNGTVDVVSGVEDPPRGWLSRYYGEKAPVPSLAAIATGALPIAFVTLACPGNPIVHVSGDDWTVSVNEKTIRFQLDSFDKIVIADKLVPEFQK